MSDLLHDVSSAIIEGDSDSTVSLVKKLIDQGEEAQKILDEGLTPGMDEVAVQFSNGDMFIPEVLESARAMSAGNELLKPLFMESNAEKKGKILIGTVVGDLHDIGKKLVGMMLEGSGFEVIDLGIDLPASKFLEVAKAEKPNIIGLSALLTTTMPAMQEVMELLKEDGLDQEIKVMIGGAPVTDAYAQSIGAHYAYDAGSAVALANKLIGSVR